jgi:pilus assembly protein Flp/PilA
MKVAAHPEALSDNQEHVGMGMYLRAFLKEESGATAIEYSLIAVLVAVVIIGALQLLGTELDTSFTSLETSLSTANAT